MNSIDESLGIFNAESKKLESMIDDASKKPTLALSEVVQTYYQIMNVSSLGILLKKQSPVSDASLIGKINETMEFISKRFDSHLHLLIMEQLASSVRDATKKLASGNSVKKSKEDIESEARLYEQLREMMSTKEFVEQYDRGLPHA